MLENSQLHHFIGTLTLSKALGLEEVDGVVVRTPAEQPIQVIEYQHLPWLEFQTLVGPCCTPKVSLSLNG